MTFKISFLYELHVVLDSAEHSANDWLSFYLLRGDWNITKFDQVSLRMDMEQRYIADPGENGLWFGDMRLYYSRKFAIPIPKFPIPGKASFYMTAPTSREDRARSYITKPTAAVMLAPGWGPLTLITQGYFRYAIAKYAEPEENSMYLNTRFTGGYMLQLVYAPLDWFAPYVAWNQAWNQAYPDREMGTQPWKPMYSFEFAADFAIPLPKEWPTLDLILAYTQGAPMIDDGVYRTYFFQRDASQLYFGINVVY
ncbi:MAG: hypothetical protein GY854_28820 [Deltaproteobacteria bacterium]|nr:hypothetical protein [Deltaproteobacteria bacterium]